MHHRQERVADAIRQVVARVIVEDLNDPGIGFVSVTRCKLTRDLKVATVYFSVLGDEHQRRQSMTQLEHAVGFIRRQVARALNLRHTPELRFAFDELREHEYRVGKLIEENRLDLPEPDVPEPDAPAAEADPDHTDRHPDTRPDRK